MLFLCVFHAYIQMYRTRSKKIKQKISDFIQNHRKMKLDLEKTKISRTTEGYNFLGFKIQLKKATNK
jgi:hypothetical protein